LLSKGSFTSFSGTDIVAGLDVPVGDTFKHYIFGELATISYSIYRPTVPVRALGFKGPKGFTKGVRLVAGTLVFRVFDRHIIYQIYEEAFKNRLLMDEMPPFHVTVVFSNEYGHASALRILGVTVVDEGQVMSIEDIYTEQTMRYLARDIVPMDPKVLNIGGG